MNTVFWNAASFNGDISDWDVSGVTDMTGMFYGASSFNGDISDWDVSGVTDMTGMFYGASSFNGDISDWDISNVEYMNDMFVRSSFDRNLGKWYIILNNTTVDSNESGTVVGNISALNEFLGKGTRYVTSSDSFTIDDKLLKLRKDLAPGLYNLTISDQWSGNTRTYEITVSGTDPTTHVVSDQTVSEEEQPTFQLHQSAPERPATKPERPQNLQASPTNSTAVLTWDDPGDSTITGYKILSRVAVPGTSLSVIDSYIGNVDSYTATGLDPETTYIFRVIAINEHGESASSGPARLTVGSADHPPDRPQDLQATPTNITIELTWDDPGDSTITGYKILSRVYTPGTDLTILVEDTSSAATSYTATGLNPETTYVFRVIAINEHGESLPSDPVRITTTPNPLPLQPQNLQATPTNTTVTLTWDDQDDKSITGYKILSRVAVPGTSLSVIDSYIGNVDSYTATGLDPETTYIFRVISTNPYGESEASHPVRISTTS